MSQREAAGGSRIGTVADKLEITELVAVEMVGDVSAHLMIAIRVQFSGDLRAAMTRPAVHPTTSAS